MCALLQSASLVLTTTPAEELALAVSTILMPLQFIGIPAKEIGEPLQRLKSLLGPSCLQNAGVVQTGFQLFSAPTNCVLTL